MTQGFLIGWTAAPVLVDATSAQFTPTGPRLLGCSNVSSPVQCVDFDFQSTLTNVGPVQSGAADMTSTFRFTARAGLNGTIVQCSAVTADSSEEDSQDLIVAGTYLNRNYCNTIWI